MGNIIIWHSKNGYLCYRTCAASYNTGSFIKGCQFTVQISGISFSGRNFALRGRYLTHGLTEGSNICKDNKDVHTFFKSQIFRSSKSNLRCNQTFYNRVICQIQVHNNMVGYTAFLKGTAEKFRYVIFYTHCSKNNGEFFIAVASKRCLLNNLRCKLVMGKSVS